MSNSDTESVRKAHLTNRNQQIFPRKSLGVLVNQNRWPLQTPNSFCDFSAKHRTVKNFLLFAIALKSRNVPRICRLAFTYLFLSESYFNSEGATWGRAWLSLNKTSLERDNPTVSAPRCAGPRKRNFPFKINTLLERCPFQNFLPSPSFNFITT